MPDCSLSECCVDPPFANPIEPVSDNFFVTITKDPEEGGEVTGGGESEKYEEVTVTATAAMGYVFAGFFNPIGVLLSETSPYTFVLMNNVIITARFV